MFFQNRAKLAQGAAELKAAVGLGDIKKKLASKSGPSLVRNSNESEILVSFSSWFTSPDFLPLDLWNSDSRPSKAAHPHPPEGVPLRHFAT